MSNRNEAWKDLIPFEFYQNKKNLIGTLTCPVTIVLNGINDKLTENEVNTQKLFIQNNDLDKIMKQELTVTHLTKNDFNVEGKLHAFLFQSWDVSLKINGHEVKFGDFLNEIKFKDASDEITALFQTQLKDGSYFEFGKSSIRKYYLQDEDHFFEFQGLIHKGQFSLPNDEVLKKDLSEFIEKDTPGASKYIMETLPTLSERVNSNGLRIRKI